MAFLYRLSKIKNNKYLQFFRVFDWAHVLGLTILGFVYASRIKINISYLIIALLISSLYLAHGYSLNEYFDVYVYKKKNKKNYLDNLMPFKTAIVSSYIVLLLNSLVSLYFSRPIFVLVLIGAFLAWLYSAPPLRLKGNSFWGLFSNSLGFSILFLLGYGSAKSIDIQAILVTSFIFFLFLPIQLIHELNDLEDDALNDIKTFAVRRGVRGTLNLTTFFLIVLMCWSYILWYFFLMPPTVFLMTILFSLALIFYLFRRFDKLSNRLNTYKFKINARYICIIYGIAILIGFLFSK